MRIQVQTIKRLPTPDTILYQYGVLFFLLVNSLATAMLVVWIGPSYFGSSTIPTALVANLFAYLMLFKALTSFRRRCPQSRAFRALRLIAAWVGGIVGVVAGSILALVGGVWFTLWLVTVYG